MRLLASRLTAKLERRSRVAETDRCQHRPRLRIRSRASAMGEGVKVESSHTQAALPLQGYRSMYNRLAALPARHLLRTRCVHEFPLMAHRLDDNPPLLPAK